MRVRIPPALQVLEMQQSLDDQTTCVGMKGPSTREGPFLCLKVVSCRWKPEKQVYGLTMWLTPLGQPAQHTVWSSDPQATRRSSPQVHSDQVGFLPFPPLRYRGEASHSLWFQRPGASS